MGMDGTTALKKQGKVHKKKIRGNKTGIWLVETGTGDHSKFSRSTKITIDA